LDLFRSFLRPGFNWFVNSVNYPFSNAYFQIKFSFFARSEVNRLNFSYAKFRNCRDLFYCRDDDFDSGNFRPGGLFFLSPIQFGKKEQPQENLEETAKKRIKIRNRKPYVEK
jgi:hypothetical protein